MSNGSAVPDFSKAPDREIDTSSPDYVSKSADFVRNLLGLSKEATETGIARMQGPGVVSKALGGAEYVASGIPYAGKPLVQAMESSQAGKFKESVLPTAEAGVQLATLPGMAERGAAQLLKGYAEHEGPSLLKVIASPSMKRELINRWVNAKGLDVQGQVRAAVKAVNQEVSTHAERFANSVDEMFPEGRIGASKILEGTQEFWDQIHSIESKMPKEVQQLFEQEFAANPEMQMLKNASVFKTRMTVDVKEFMRTAAPAAKAQMSKILAEEEKGASTGIAAGTKWTARQAQDLRSNLGSLMSRVHNSPAADTLKKKAAAAATKAYASISQEMKDAADDAGVRDSFDQYNAVKRRLEKMIDGPLGKILGSDSGHEVAEHLATGKDRTRELVQSLGKYGLDPKTVQKFMSDYGEVRPYTGPTDVVKRDWSKFIAGYAAGIGLQKLGKVPIPAYVYGLGAGVGWPAVKRAITALQARKLPQEIIGALSEREIPAPLP